MLWQTAIVSTNYDATVFLSFAPDVSDEIRADFATRLQDGDWTVRQGMAQQTRSETLVVIVACLTLVGTGFAQRFGEIAADRALSVVKAALAWLRGRKKSPPAVSKHTLQPVLEQPAETAEVVDIVDKESGLVIRLTGSEPDTTLDVLRVLLEHRCAGNDEPVMWDGESWS